MADNPGIAFSDAFAKQQQLGINDRAQRATEQQQQFEQDAARKAEAERHIAQLLTVASNITKAASEAGNNPMTIAGSIQPLGDTAAQIANDTYGPDGGARVQRMFQALLARPPLEDKTSKKQFVTVPGGPFEGSTGYTFDTGTGTLSAPLTGPGKQSKNLTAPETTITGISVDGQPTETPPSPTPPAPDFNQRFAATNAPVTSDALPQVSVPADLPPGPQAIDFAIKNNITGEEFLKTIPTNYRSRVKAIAEYREDPRAALARLKGAERNQIMSAVHQYSAGSYDMKYYPAMSAAVKEFLAGGNTSPAGQITAGNVAIQHLKTVGDAVDAMDAVPGLLDKIAKSNTSFASYAAKALQNKAVAGTSEGRALQAFLTARNRYAEEITKFYAGSQGAEADRQRTLDTLDAAKTRGELYSALNTETDLLDGKVNVLQDRWKTALSGPKLFDATIRQRQPDFPIIQGKTREALDNVRQKYIAIRFRGQDPNIVSDPLGLFSK